MRVIKKDVLNNHIKKLSEEKTFILVVKDNAYGFGIELLVELGMKHGIFMFAVKNIEEARCVRKCSEKVSILLLGKLNPKLLNDVIELNVIPTINDYDDYLLFKENHINAHLAIDIGMNRFGVKNGYLAIINDPIVKAIYTHVYEKEALEKIAWIEDLALRYQKPLHIGGSMAYRHTRAPLRVGKMIYEDAIYYYGNIVNIKSLKKGETVGYDSHYKADDDILIGVCDIGYSNGLNLFYTGQVAIHNKLYQCVGRSCMDQCFILIDEQVSIGDEVEFFGKTISEEYFAQHNQMSRYEVFLNMI